MASISRSTERHHANPEENPGMSHPNNGERNSSINKPGPGEKDTVRDSVGRELKEMNLLDPDTFEQTGFNQEEFGKLRGRERRKAVLLLRQWRRETSTRKHPCRRRKIFALLLVLLLTGVAMNIELVVDTTVDTANQIQDRFRADSDDIDPITPPPPVNHDPEINLPNEWGEGKEGEYYISDPFGLMDEDGDALNASLECLFGSVLGEFNLVNEGNNTYHIKGLPKSNGTLEFRIWYGDGKHVLNEDIEIPFAPKDIEPPINHTPEINPDAPTHYNATEDIPLLINFSSYFTDPDNDLVKISCNSTFVNLSSNQALFPDPGAYQFTLHGEDPYGLDASVNITVNVGAGIPENQPPQLNESMPNEFERYIGQEFEKINLKDYVYDPEGKDLEFLCGSPSANISKDGELEFLDYNHLGKNTVNVTAKDPYGAAKVFQLNFTVNEKPHENQPPELNLPEIHLSEDSSIQINLNNYALDEDPANLTFSVYPLLDGINVSLEDGIANISGWENWYGNSMIIVNATDSENLSNESKVDVIVDPVYDPMRIEKFEVSQNMTNGNLFDLLIELNATDAKIAKGVFEFGNFSMEYIINAYNATIKDQFNCSHFNPNKPYTAYLNATDDPNKTIEDILSGIYVKNDIWGEATAQGLNTNFPEVYGNFSGIDDILKRIWVNLTRAENLIDQYYKEINNETYMLYKLWNLSNKTPGLHKMNVTIEDEFGANWSKEFELNVPDDPAVLKDYSMSENRTNFEFSCTVEDPDDAIGSVKGKFDNNPAFDLDGNFNSKIENAETNKDISSLSSRGHSFHLYVDGVEIDSFDFWKAVEPYITNNDYEFNNRWINGSANLQADTHDNLNITELYQKLNNGEWQKVDIDPANNIAHNYNINLKHAPKGQNNDLFIKLIDDEGEKELLLVREYNPLEPEFKDVIVKEKTLDEIVINGVLDSDGVDIQQARYRIDNGEWKQLNHTDGNFELTENISSYIGEHELEIEFENTWEEKTNYTLDWENDAEEMVYQVLFKHRLNEGDNEDNHRQLCIDLINGCGNVTLQDYYNGLDSIVNKLKLNKTETNDILQHLALGELNASEVAAANNLYDVRSDLANYPNLFLWYLEWDSIKDRAINTTDDQMIDDGIDILEDMDATERLLLNLDQILSKDNRAARIGDWFFTKYAKEKGLNMSNPEVGRFGFYYPAVFDAFEVDNWTFDYIPKQLEFFDKVYGIENLSKSGAAIPYVIRPWISLSTNQYILFSAHLKSLKLYYNPLKNLIDILCI